MATGDPWVFAKQREENLEEMSIKMILPENSIMLNAGETEMIRVAKDGFCIRGEKVNQDDKESEKVYNAFKQWLEWSMLQQE